MRVNLRGAAYDRLWTDPAYKANMDEIITQSDPSGFAWQLLPFNDPEFAAYVRMLRPDAFVKEERLAAEYAAYYQAHPDVIPTQIGPSEPMTALEAAAAIIATQEAQQMATITAAQDVLTRMGVQAPGFTSPGIPYASSNLGPPTAPLSADYGPVPMTDTGGGAITDPSLLFTGGNGAGAPATEGKGGAGMLLAALGALAFLGG